METVAVILAAGKGTRMQSDLPKVLFPVGGRPMIHAVVDACRAAGVQRVVAVVGHKQELVRDALKNDGVEFVAQEAQLGTGHAVSQAVPLLAGAKDVLVLCGDGPLIRAETVRTLLGRHRETGAAATLATAVIDAPEGYGRIARDAAGGFAGIVEHKNATPAQRAITEVNPSYYCFDGAALLGALPRLTRNGVSGEYYITDVLSLLLADGKRVEVVDAVPPQDVLSINTPDDLAKVDAIYRARPAQRKLVRA